MNRLFCLLPALLMFSAGTLFAQTGYRKPPPEVLSVLNAPPPPALSVNPTRTHVLLLQGVRYPPIEELAQPMLRLAGLRIDPRTNGPHRAPYYIAARLQALDGRGASELKLPAGARFGSPRWSPDGARFAILNESDGGAELWLGETATGAIRQLTSEKLNAAYGVPLQWMPDNRTLLVQLIPAGRGRPPAAAQAPIGPVTQESAGKAAPVRTYQDLLANPHDEALFDYYAASQLALIDTASGKRSLRGAPGLYMSTDPSPDGRHLLVIRTTKPYSYLLPYTRFPREVEIWDNAGKLVHKFASLPLADKVPIDGVTTGPRSIRWHPTQPATLVWAEALDGGDPRAKAPRRDKLLAQASPFKAAPVELLQLEHRFMGIEWLESGGLAFVRDYDRDRRWSRAFLADTERPGAELQLVWSRSAQDRYRHPGDPIQRTLPSGHRAILRNGDTIYLSGEGASPEGDRPFLDAFNLKTRESKRLFHCDASSYEAVAALIDHQGPRVLTRRESPAEPPNYYVRDLNSGGRTAVTNNPDPAPQLRQIKKQLVTYKRADGVPLSFTLYLPPGYRQGERYPTLVWAYPREFNDPDVAGQVVGSTQRFTTLTGSSHLFFLLAGYVILDGAAMPVVGDPQIANDTYIDQVVASAKAAIDKAAEMGVTDPARVGVGGHSYGAFMTANLLAHSDLFRAGIARSGAYNRTLTPFGFQNERRTLWEAPDVYARMSPFMSAHKINEPLLLIHGEADNNAGTFPVQSERMYQAVRGNGGVTRLVMLPHESHGYAARESIEHTLAEMIGWLDKHVKTPGRQARGREEVTP